VPIGRTGGSAGAVLESIIPTAKRGANFVFCGAQLSDKASRIGGRLSDFQTRQSDELHASVIVAVITVWVMQSVVHEIIDMITARYCFVSTI
jgi:hypothetical protein